MAIAFVNAATANINTAATTPLTISKPASVVDGHLLLALIWWWGFETITLPSGYTQIGTTTTDGTNGWKSARARKIASSEGASYDFSFSGDVIGVGSIVAYSGVDQTTPVEVVGSVTTDTGEITSHSAPSITTLTDNSRVVAMYAGSWADTSPGWTPPGSTTERVDYASGVAENGGNLHIADYDVATAGSSGAKSATSVDAMNSMNVQIALKPAAAGGGTTRPPSKNIRQGSVHRGIGSRGIGGNLFHRAASGILLPRLVIAR